MAKNKLKYRLVTFGGVLAILVLIIYCIALIAWPIGNISPVIASQTIRQKSAPNIIWPSYGQGAIYTENYGLLGTNGNQNPIPIASITKIITALTVLHNKPINNTAQSPLITFSAADLEMYNRYLAQDGVVAPVTPGSSISQYDLMQIMLIASANNYAETLAVWAFGSVDNYLAAAKEYLAENGLSNTTVLDSAGFAAGSASTASDLVKLGHLALDNPILSEIVAKPSVTIAGIGTFNTTNTLVAQGKAIGIKTGNTNEAGYCLLFANKTDVSGSKITLIGAILGGTSRASVASDAAALLNSTSAGFYSYEFAKDNQVFATYKTPWGATANLISKNKASAAVWLGDPIKIDVNAPTISPSTATVSDANVTLTAGKKTAVAKLSLNHPIAKPSTFWRLTHPLILLGL